MAEIPLNLEPEKKEVEQTPAIAEKTVRKNALRPKAKSSPKKLGEDGDTPQTTKPLVKNSETEEIYAISNTRGNWMKHVVGQAAWGILLDEWTTLCGWHFARRNVKVERAKRFSRRAESCKK